ncbi:MAG: hypothetical protein ACRERU_12665 [Methylococcales bacterium]
MTLPKYPLLLMVLAVCLTSGSALARGGGGHGFGGGHVGGGHHGGWYGGWHSGWHGGWHGGWYGGWRGGFARYGGWNYYSPYRRPRLSIFLGSSLFWPPYYSWPYSYSAPNYYPYSYYPSFLAAQSMPPVYIEQGNIPQVQPLEANYWDYCVSSGGYYPHVKECPAGWQRIASQPVHEEPGYWYYCNNSAGYYPYVRECSGSWQKLVP